MFQLVQTLTFRHIHPVFALLPLSTPLLLDCKPDAATDLGEDVPLGRLHHIEGLPKDDDHGGHQHEDGRDTKGEGVAGVVSKAMNILPYGRGKQCTNQGACVYAEIEHRKERLQLSLLKKSFIFPFF